MTHLVDGLSLSACKPGDRIELLTETEHWIVDKISATSYWLSLFGSLAGVSRITPRGTKLDDVLSTDWLQEGGYFTFYNHRTSLEDMVAEPVKLLTLKKNYTLLEETSNAPA